MNKKWSVVLWLVIVLGLIPIRQVFSNEVTAMEERTGTIQQDNEIAVYLEPYMEGIGVLLFHYPEGTKEIQFGLSLNESGFRSVSVDPVSTSIEIELNEEEFLEFTMGKEISARRITTEGLPEDIYQIIIDPYVEKDVNYLPFSEGEEQIIIFHEIGTRLLQIGLEPGSVGRAIPIDLETTKTVIQLTDEEKQKFTSGKQMKIRSLKNNSFSQFVIKEIKAKETEAQLDAQTYFYGERFLTGTSSHAIKRVKLFVDSELKAVSNVLEDRSFQVYAIGNVKRDSTSVQVVGENQAGETVATKEVIRGER